MTAQPPIQPTRAPPPAPAPITSPQQTALTVAEAEAAAPAPQTRKSAARRRKAPARRDDSPLRADTQQPPADAGAVPNPGLQDSQGLGTAPGDPSPSVTDVAPPAHAPTAGDGVQASDHAPPAAPAAPSYASIARRVMPARAAADTAERDARRRRAAVVLQRRFPRLPFPDVLATIRACSDDYATAIAWAVEAHAGKCKPNMQGKSEKSLQKLFFEMTDAAARHAHDAVNDTTPTSDDE